MANGFCPICGGAVKNEGKFINRLADGTVVCEKCAARTRFRYPVKADTEKKQYREARKTRVATVDYEQDSLENPVGSMSLEEFRQALEETDRMRAEETAAYKPYRCVILVDLCRKVIRTQQDINGEEKYPKEMPYQIMGRVLYGELRVGDVLHVRRKEREELIHVTHVLNAPAGTICFDAEAVFEGSYASFSVAEEACFVYPADILYSV